MARSLTPKAKLKMAQLTPDEMQQGINRLQKRLEEVDAFDPTSVIEQFNIPHVEALAASIDDALIRTFGADTLDYKRYSDATFFDNGPHNYMHRVPIEQVQASLARSKARSKALLEQAIASLQERIGEGTNSTEPEEPTNDMATATRKVFIVHGHDDAALQAVARFLEKLKLEAIVLREQPDQGRTIIEKFEDYASEVGFAVVLLTPDDLVGAAATPSQTSRARQNVIFELGYFVGKLGRGRACLLRKGEVEIPSDLYGVIYSEMDPGEGWKLKLAREFTAAKLDFDSDQVWA